MLCRLPTNVKEQMLIPFRKHTGTTHIISESQDNKSEQA